MVAVDPSTEAPALSLLVSDFKDWRQQGSAMRAGREKGVRRSLLFILWISIHTYEAVALGVYGGAWAEPALAAVWLICTLLSGCLYLRLMFSNPGFVEPALLQKLVDDAGVGIQVAGEGAAIVVKEVGEDEHKPLKQHPDHVLLSDLAEGNASHEKEAIELESPHKSVLALNRCDSSDNARPSDLHGGSNSAADAEAAIPPASEGSAQTPGLNEQRESAALEGIEVRESLVETGGKRNGKRNGKSAKPHFRVEGDAASYFYDFAPDVGMLVPIRGKFCKKHGQVIGKFDHYCYLLGNSVGELNHGLFWRMLCAQVISIWLMKGIIDRHYMHFSAGSPWAAANVPLMILDVLAYVFGIPLSFVLLIHSYLAATSTTTFEFIRMEKLDYLRGFYEFSCPFSQGLCTNLRHFCCPRGLQLWARPPPESEWPETWWRNRYYSCFG